VLELIANSSMITNRLVYFIDLQLGEEIPLMPNKK
jgi:hypothetical protein